MFDPDRIRGKRDREQKTGHTHWGTAVLLHPAVTTGDGSACFRFRSCGTLPGGEKEQSGRLCARQNEDAGRRSLDALPFDFTRQALPPPDDNSPELLGGSLRAVPEKPSVLFFTDFTCHGQQRGRAEEERNLPSRVNPASDRGTGRSRLSPGRAFSAIEWNCLRTFRLHGRLCYCPAVLPVFKEERSFCNRYR